MVREDNGVSEATALNEIDKILKRSMERFKHACICHIPFCTSVGREKSIKYIPERCIVTYFAWGLIDADFAVFNEQIVKWKKKLTYPLRFDMLARRFSPEGSEVQIKLEAKGNLDSGYKEILADIKRMEDYTVEIPEIKMSNPESNRADDRFPYRFNMVLTQNWGIRELSDWWRSEDDTHPKRRKSQRLRDGKEWGELKQKLLSAKKRGVIPILKSAPDYNPPYTIDILYAIFEDTSVEYKKEVLRKAQKDS